MQSGFSNIQLNEQQLDMLQFKTLMPEEDYLQNRSLAVQFLPKKVDEEMERLEKGWTQDTYEQ
jgi:hypothetical protein